MSAALPVGGSAPLFASATPLVVFADLEHRGLPGGDTILFPPGLEQEIFRQTHPEARNMTREQFQQRVNPGFGPAIKDSRYAAGIVARFGVNRVNQAIETFNRNAAAAGLPTIPTISPRFQEIIAGESLDQGDDAGQGGAESVAEVSPQWRSDP